MNASNLTRPGHVASRDLLLRVLASGAAVAAIMGLLPLLLELAA